MISDRYLELINQEIDGVNTPEQSREVRRYLDADPKAKNLYDELQELGRVFDWTARIEPPPLLRERIMFALEQRAERPEERPEERPQAQPQAQPARRPEERPPLFPRPVSWRRPASWQPAWLFGAGILTCLALLALGSLLIPEPDSVLQRDGYGSLTGPRRAEGDLVADGGQFTLAGLEGTVTAAFLRETVLLTLEAATDRPVEIRIDHDPLLHLAAFRPGQKSDVALVQGENFVVLTHEGTTAYALEFDGEWNPGSFLRVAVLADGRLHWERNFEAGR